MELSRWCFWYGDGVKEFALFATWVGRALSCVFSCDLCWLQLLSLFVGLSDGSHESGTFLGEAFVLHF